MASDGDAPGPDTLAESLTIWASPGLVTDTARPDLGSIPALTVVPSLSVSTRDSHPAAEPVDLIASALLGQGFQLLTAFDPATLVELPILPDWSAEFSPDNQHLTVTEPGGILYDGDLGAKVPLGWHEAVLDRRGLLVLLVSSDINLTGAGRVASMDAARRAGSVVGAQIRAARRR
jgi:hypothetical protein